LLYITLNEGLGEILVYVGVIVLPGSEESVFAKLLIKLSKLFSQLGSGGGVCIFSVSLETWQGNLERGHLVLEMAVLDLWDLLAVLFNQMLHFMLG
jgi:hypothetical protein